MNNTGQGYITVKLGEESKTAHFGMNFIKILRDEFGVTLTEMGAEMESNDQLDSYVAFSKLLYSAFKAFDVQNNNLVDYTPDHCLEWSLGLNDKQTKEFEEVMLYALSLNNMLSEMGKQKRAVSPPTK